IDRTGARRGKLLGAAFASVRSLRLCVKCLFGICAAAQTEGLHFSIEPGPVIVEDLGGSFGVSTSVFERLRNRFALDLFHREVWWNNTTELARVRGVKLLG